MPHVPRLCWGHLGQLLASCPAALSPFCRAVFPEQQSQDLFLAEREVIKKAYFAPLKMLYFFRMLLTRASSKPAAGMSASYTPFYLTFPKIQSQVHGVNLLP